jgi:hypothetical protein
MRYLTFAKGFAFVLFSLVLIQASGGADTPAIYTGANGGNWSLGSNWSPTPAVPANSGGTTFAVTIPDSTYVNFDLAGSTSINALTLKPNSTLVLGATDNLTVVNAFTSTGALTANGANFTASGIISVDGSSFYAVNGTVSLAGLTTYASGTGNEFRAEGAGAKINASGLTKIDFGTANNYLYINAFNGGEVDAHNLTTIAGTSGVGDPVRVQSFGTGSVVNFGALGSTADYLSLDVRDGGSVLWNNPASLQGSIISKTGATSILNTSNLSNLDRSSLYAAGGATLAFPSLKNFMPGTGTEFRSDGIGSTLDLSALLKIDLGAANNYLYVNAVNGGTIDAHNLTTIAGTSGIGQPIRVQSFGTGSVVNLASLGSAPGALSLDIRDGGSVLWGSPTTVQGASISKSGAASILNTSALSNIDGSNFYAGTGGVMSFPALTKYTPGQGSELRADGADAKLDFSALTKLDFGAANNYLYVDAYNGGVIDAHNLSTITGTSGINQPLRIQVFGTGSSLIIPAPNTAPGFLSVDLRDGGSVLWGNPTTLQNDSISKTGATSVINTSNLSNIDGSNFYAGGGATMSFAALHTFTPGSYSELRADGAGSSLDLTSLNTITLGAANNFVYIDAYNGGSIDAHNLQNVTGTSGVGTPLRFQIFTNASIDVSNLAYTPGILNLDLRDGSTFLWSKPATLDRDNISMTNGSTLDTSSLKTFTNGSFTIGNATTGFNLLSNVNGSSFYVSGGATVDLPALQTFTPGEYSEFRSDGAGTKFSLTALTTLDLGAANNYVYFDAYNGGLLDVSNLQTVTGTSGTGTPIRVQAFNADSKVDLTKLPYTSNLLSVDLRDGATMLWSKPATLDRDMISISNGSTLDTSALTTFTNGNFTVSNSTTNLAALSNASGSNIFIGGGSVISLPSLKSYTPGSYTELRADGSGTLLDLSALGTIDFGAASNYVYLEAYNGGIVDAHKLTALAGNSTVSSALRIQSFGSGSLVNLPGLALGLPQDLPYGADIDIRDGGTVQIKELGASGAIGIGENNSRLTVGGSLVLETGSTLTMGAASTLSVKRDFSFVHTDPGSISATQSTLIFDGSGQQRIEAGGKDVALNTASLANDNFAFGRLIVGQAGQAPTIVAVRDDIDNGQRAPGMPESLYLFGPQGRIGSPQGGDPDAVDILGGSTLLIRNLNVFAVQAGAMVNLQTLIPAGQKIIPYKDGYLSRSFSAVPGAWNVDAAGDWNTAGNWLLSGVPNAAGASAVFGDKITADRIVTLNTTNTVGFLGFDGAKSYTISGAGGLNLTNVGGLRAQIQANNDSGNANHTVNVSLNLQADLDLISYSTGTLNLAGALNNPSAKNIIKDGPGLIAISGVQNHGAGTQIITQGGTLRLDSDASKKVTLNQVGGTTLVTVTQHLGGLSASGGATQLSPTGTKSIVLPAPAQFSGTGQIDLSTHNGLIIDYTAGSPSSLADIRDQIISAHNPGGPVWAGPGITSSVAAVNSKVSIGYAEASSLLGPSGGTFLGEHVDGSAILVRATINGDSNLDGKTDFTDLVAVAQHYGMSGMTWQTGDFDYDQNVGFSDLVAVAQNYGGAVAGPVPGATPEFEHDLAAAFAQVPEPSALPILVAVGMMAMRRKRFA